MRLLWLPILTLSFLANAGPSIDTQLAERQQALDRCMQALPAQQAMAWQESRGKGAFPKACKEAKRSRDDARDILALRNDLIGMTKEDTAQQEADDIATQLVQTTRQYAEEFKMVNSSFLNNILVNIGKKKGGQCYQWVRVLIPRLHVPYKNFEIIWGGAHLNRVMENNSVIITARGQPLSTGILYDAWRGGGNAWWRRVSDDHYPWTVRFSEQDILAGNAIVEGKSELKHPTIP